ncbi:hypothetical protein GCM10009021_27230 [Halarchaeum nitratireducens]|uniref:Uncharacterized protein n=1 Tax=Halarchaeum nitratireducens TaxID=489913 RepID=A0A830GES5_9EURY|nr:hypothetical protein GCM10009021_27230 [Halarchaeum nitratireducens]
MGHQSTGPQVRDAERERRVHAFRLARIERKSTDKSQGLTQRRLTKCRFPILKKQYLVRDGEVLHADLSSPDPIDE